MMTSTMQENVRDSLLYPNVQGNALLSGKKVPILFDALHAEAKLADISRQQHQ